MLESLKKLADYFDKSGEEWRKEHEKDGTTAWQKGYAKGTAETFKGCALLLKALIEDIIEK